MRQRGGKPASSVWERGGKVKGRLYSTIAAFYVIALFLVSPGCTRMALKFSGPMVSKMAGAFFEECDPELARQALPAQLKLMEGLLKNDKQNRSLLASLCMGFAGYAMLFVEDEEPERASRLYLRARSYGFRALGLDPLILKNPPVMRKELGRALESMDAEDMESFMWTIISWQAWINLNLDRPTALAQLSNVEFCLKKIVRLAPDFFYGTPCILMGSLLAAKPGLLGGKPSEARKYFEKAFLLGQGKFLLAHYYFAKYYSVRVQDKALFMKMIEQIHDSPPGALKQACLINAVVKEKAVRLEAMADELFL